MELFKRRHGRLPSFEKAQADERGFRILNGDAVASGVSTLIGCTFLIDKATMIWKLRLVDNASRASVLGFFNDLKEIRDRCAHPGTDEELISKDGLAQFVAAASHMRADLAASLHRK